MISGAQVRAARALLDWSIKDLSERSNVSAPTIQRIERQHGLISSQPRTVIDLQKAIEEAGLEFIGTPDNGPGVRYRPKTS
jgi:transcriptional regulator with XRE-family HTH domain